MINYCLLVDGLRQVVDTHKPNKNREEFRIRYGIVGNDFENNRNDNYSYYINDNKNNNHNKNDNKNSYNNNDNDKNNNNNSNNDNNDSNNIFKSNVHQSITMKEMCQCILLTITNDNMLQQKEWKVGTNSVYLYRHQHFQILQNLKNLKFESFVVKVQNVWRQYLCQKIYQKIRNEKSEKKRKYKLFWENKINYFLECVIKIQKTFRGKAIRQVKKIM